MDSHSAITRALEQYIRDKGGHAFYAKRVNTSKSHVTRDGYVVLWSAQKPVEVARYSLDDLGFTPEQTFLLLGNNDALPKTQADDDESPGLEVTVSDKRTLIGVSGAALVALGCFSPIVKLPIVREISYVNNLRTDGMIVLLSSGAIFYCIVTGKRYVAKILAEVSLLVTFTTFWLLQIKIGEFRSSIDRDLSGNPFKGIAIAAADAMGLGWGWILLFSGLTMVLCHVFLEQRDGDYYLPSHVWRLNLKQPQQSLVSIFIGSLAAGLILAAIIAPTIAAAS
ncbi:MAG: hypothetical protein VKJ66_04025 [Synechococcus sp.]|nr:hypothetical protein [Synechococcus sp.]